MRAHLNMGSPEVMVCSFRISDLIDSDPSPMEAPQQQLGGSCTWGRWQPLVPGHPFRLKQGTSQQMARQFVTAQWSRLQSRGMAPAPSRELKSKWTWAEAMSWGLGTWVHLGPLFVTNTPSDRAQTVVSTAAKDGAGMQWTGFHWLKDWLSILQFRYLLG